MSDGRVGGELEHHDDILLHLILKHQWALGKETLVRQTEKCRGTERGGRRTGYGDGGRGKDGTGKGEGTLVGEQGQSRYTH